MNPKVVAWLQIGSNVGILVGLLLVALQMKQASEIAEAQLGSEGLLATMGAFELMVGEHLDVAWSKAMTNAPEMTDAELGAIDAFLAREWTSAMRLGSLADQGFNDGPDFTTIDKWVFSYLGNDYSLRWWRAARDHIRILNPPMYDAIDAKLATQGADHRTLHARRLSDLRSRDPVVTDPINPTAN